SNINAVIVFHQYPTDADIADLQTIGILGGTKYKMLPMIAITTTRDKLMAVSLLPSVRSIYGNRTLDLSVDPFFKTTQIQKVAVDQSLQQKNAGMPVSGRNVTVAVLDTGVNGTHNDLAGKVVQNVRLVDTQSAAVGFINPAPVENLLNTDLVNGHGTFVAGVIAASGISSGGKYSGVAPGANILGLSAGDLNLSHVLSGFDYILEKGANYNVKVVNCSFSADTVFDYHDPVNVATQMVTNRGISVIFSAGNTGAGNGTLNPYAAAPWVVSVGATDESRRLAEFSSRGVFGSQLFSPSVVAPGVNVVSLRSTATQMSVLGVGAGADTQRLTPAELPFYTTASGTSFSAPQVAGAIALMLEANPNLSPLEAKDILQRSATPLASNYAHEVGAGMLNTYAAVLEAANPSITMGLFRAVSDREVVNFVTSTSQTFSGTVNPYSVAVNDVSIPLDTIQANISIGWGGILSPNDLGLKVYGENSLLGESNYLNLPFLNGRLEKVTINNPTAGTLQSKVSHSLNNGTPQSYSGTVEITQVEYNGINDIDDLSVENQSIVLESLRRFLMLPEGSKFKYDSKVSRSELAEVLVRSGLVPQYVAPAPVYSDVRDMTTRGVVESVQMSPNGKLILDSSNNGKFDRNDAATKLVTAIALVKANNLDSLAATSSLSGNITDAASIPALYRGYVAVALEKGWLTLDNNKFNPNNAVTRLEITKAIVALTR
ncbi:MAG: S8 family serine peptidase, partial [Pyrinomonadaceae bacterium]